MFAKTIRRWPLIAWFACLILLAILSISMMCYLEDFEDPRFRLPHLAKLHLIWYSIAFVGLGLSFVISKLHPNLFAGTSLGFAIITLTSAILWGKITHGLPYLQLGKLNINATEA